MSARAKRATEAFFGRRRGRRLRPLLADALARRLDGLKLDLERPAPDDLAGLFEAEVDRFRLEIGFGSGEHLMAEARRLPRTGFIGVEPFVNGVARFLAEIGEAPPPNVRIYDDDATRLLDWLPRAHIHELDLLYPDPWPKRRHWKRRFVNRANLDRFSRILRPGGRFCFASDVPDYVDWTLIAVARHPDFAWQAMSPADWQQPFPGWQGTRYEAKALAAGRRPAYLTFLRS